MPSSERLPKNWKVEPTDVGGIISTYFLDVRLQTFALVRKNFILLKRAYRTTALSIAVPFLFVGLLFLLQFSLQSNERRNEVRAGNALSTLEPFAPLQRCKPALNSSECYTFGYTSSLDANVVRVMEDIRVTHDVPTNEMRGWRSVDESNAYMNAVRICCCCCFFFVL